MTQGSGGAAPEDAGDVLASPPDGRDVAGELAAPPRRPLPWVTLALAACVIAAGGFAAGALVEKNHGHGTQNTAGRGGPTSGTGGRFGGAGGRFGGTGGTGGSAGPSGGLGAGITFGTVKSVDGGTLYLTDPQGGTVKVTTGASTRVTESKQGAVGDLKPGQSVTVRGQRGSNGDIAATTVTEGAPGGGFGGFGGRGRQGTQDGQSSQGGQSGTPGSGGS